MRACHSMERGGRWTRLTRTVLIQILLLVVLRAILVVFCCLTLWLRWLALRVIAWIVIRVAFITRTRWLWLALRHLHYLTLHEVSIRRGLLGIYRLLMLSWGDNQTWNIWLVVDTCTCQLLLVDSLVPFALVAALLAELAAFTLLPEVAAFALVPIVPEALPIFTI